MEPGPLRIAVTGPPGCGKSTLCLRVAEALRDRGFRVGGLATADLREGGARVGFELRDLSTGARGTLARIHPPTGPGGGMPAQPPGAAAGPMVGKYHVNLADLDTIGAGAIEGALRGGVDLVVDEVGPMELHSPRFIAAVEGALRSPLHLLASVHQRAGHPLARRLRAEMELHVLSPANRDESARILTRRFAEALGAGEEV
ncbi:MAG: NTPase [Euryarchaeota archaeon]|nr:NTPase [Euryarchaeota archaeon]